MQMTQSTWGSFRGFNGFNSWNLQTEKIWLRHTWVVAAFSTAASINWSNELQRKVKDFAKMDAEHVNQCKLDLQRL